MVLTDVDFRHHPWRGLGFLGLPFFLMIGGAGGAAVQGGDLMVGIPVTLLGFACLLPWLHSREVRIEDDVVFVRSGLPGWSKSERHPRSALRALRWRERHPKTDLDGAAHTMRFDLELVGDDDVVIALPYERPRVDAARELGLSLGLPVERHVDGKVVERWDAQGQREAPAGP